MSNDDIKKLSAEYVVWDLDIKKGEITLPDGKIKKVNYFQRSKACCTTHWNIPQSLDKAMELLTQMEWTIDLQDKELKYDEIIFSHHTLEEVYYEDEQGNGIDLTLADKYFNNGTEEFDHSFINACYGISDIILTNNNNKQLHLKNNKELFLEEFKEFLSEYQDKFKQIKKVIEFKEEPKVVERSEDIKDDPIPF